MKFEFWKSLRMEITFKWLFSLQIQSVIFDEISLPDLSVAECSIKNANHSFQVRWSSYSDVVNYMCLKGEKKSSIPLYSFPLKRILRRCCVCVHVFRLYGALGTLGAISVPLHSLFSLVVNIVKRNMEQAEEEAERKSVIDYIEEKCASPIPKRPRWMCGSLGLSLCVCVV